jgi:hypothetical protein
MTTTTDSPLTKAQVEQYADEMLHTSVNLTARKLVIRIAQAAAKAERERCAKVAEAERVFVSAPGHPSAPERIAAAIRGDAK